MLDAVRKFRPPSPIPHAERLRLVELLRVAWNNPIEAWSRAHFNQRVVVSKYAFGEFVVINDRTAIRRLLLENTDNYRKDALQKRVMSLVSNGLLTSEGEQWRFQRTALAPIFSRRSVLDFAPAMQQAVDDLIGGWHSRDGQTVDVAAESAELALDVLARTIFSDGLGCDRHELRAGMRAFFDALGRIDPFDILGLPDAVPRLTRLRAGSALRLFDAAINTMIAARRRRLATNGRDVPRDILTLLMTARDRDSGRAMSEEEVRGNILTFMSAGHETSANAITWTLYLLSQSYQWRDLVLTEAHEALGETAEATINRLPITRAVVEESLRLYPPIVSISRVAVGADELAGQAIHPGTMVIVAPYVLHRHRSLWERPDEFDPNRFLGPARAAIDRYAYLPFGAGARGCIGSVFALQESVLAVAAITRNFHLELAPDHDVWPLQRVALRPRGGLPMLLRSRQCLASTVHHSAQHCRAAGSR